MDTTKKSSEQVPFLERPIVRTILPIAGFVIICVLFAVLTPVFCKQRRNSTPETTEMKFLPFYLICQVKCVMYCVHRSYTVFFVDKNCHADL